MALDIFWTPKAIETFNQVIDYLSENWTEKVVQDFTHKVDKTLKLLQSNHVTFRTTDKLDVFEVLITKHNLLIYRVKANQIQLLRFFDTRQHPDKKNI